MKLRSAVIFALLGLSDAAPAIGARNDPLWDATWRVGYCLVKKQYAQAKLFVLDYPAAADPKLQHIPQVDSCTAIFMEDSIQVTFLPSNYRYAIANALVSRDYSSWGPQDLANAPALAQPQPLLTPKTREQQKSASVFKTNQLYARVEAEEATMGECIVRASPVDAREWLLTKPGSLDDATGAKKLTPAFETCVRKLNLHWQEFVPEQMRGPVALNFYRLAELQHKQNSGTAH